MDDPMMTHPQRVMSHLSNLVLANKVSTGHESSHTDWQATSQTAICAQPTGVSTRRIYTLHAGDVVKKTKSIKAAT